MELTDLPGAVLRIITPYLAQGNDALQPGPARLDTADLEISLHRRQGTAYSVETRFTPPGSSVEQRLGANELIEITFNEGRLGELAIAYDWVGYGQALSAALFGPEALKLAFGQAQARAGLAPLRLRLLFGPTAQELQRLRWETLRNPVDDTLLAADQKLLFSRYLAGAGGREVSPRLRANVKALAVIANPTDLADYSLAEIDAAGELRRVRESLKNVRLNNLSGENRRSTFAELVRSLQDGYDLLYLTAHGSLARGQAWLWLENETGQAARVSGDALAAQIRLLDNPPLLAVLASCESAGNGQSDALQALGPLICEAGIPAVIAMQGQISMTSMAAWMSVFFEKLLRDEVVDLAMAAARAALAASGAPDAWMPVLFMRLKDGAIWKSPDAGKAPAAVINLWSVIQDKFHEKAAAESALDDLIADAEDPDNQQVFSIQLKKALKEDGQFAGELAASVAAALESKANAAPQVSIHVGGNVGGSIVVGNSNTLN